LNLKWSRGVRGEGQKIIGSLLRIVNLWSFAVGGLGKNW